MPHFGRDAKIRVRGALGHELSWAYYRTRRHPAHPLRQVAPDPLLPIDFWRDLRPPFHVGAVTKIDDGTPHPNGVLYKVAYECPLDFCSEHDAKVGSIKQDGGSFDNKVRGVAQVRIPEGFPAVRHSITIISWGEPSVKPELRDQEAKPIDPAEWSPIADLLGLRPDDPRLKGCREAMKRVSTSKGPGVSTMHKTLIGPHPSLPRLVRCERALAKDMENSNATGEGLGPSPKKREHRIYTAAAGFVRYHG